PVSRFEYTMEPPSGENEGSVSSPASLVIRMASSPPTGCTQMSRLPAPARSDAYASSDPSGESAGSTFRPGFDVSLTSLASDCEPECVFEEAFRSQPHAITLSVRTIATAIHRANALAGFSGGGAVGDAVAKELLTSDGAGVD